MNDRLLEVHDSTIVEVMPDDFTRVFDALQKAGVVELAGIKMTKDETGIRITRDEDRG